MKYVYKLAVGHGDHTTDRDITLALSAMLENPFELTLCRREYESSDEEDDFPPPWFDTHPSPLWRGVPCDPQLGD